MTGISGIGGPPPPGGPRPVRRGGLFSVPPEDAAEAPPDAGQAQQAAPAAALASMLALQEAGAEPVRDRMARRHGLALLAALNQLQRDLLDGAPDPNLLSRLADLAGSVPPAADPRLAAVLQAIGLRARVELARRA